ncbi:type II secretion system protein [Bacillus sp. DNRA2]|uniref:type II secretion system protein n=1 Tax=Bacillus sp. DNRA2 TaxID=2723053 RepID=UPI00145CBA20|nr:type II secretion system protein [Bacillus sp. DNRA2]NMD70530.1 type II secretion system protein [Bacillus sp. DNRA2]
MNNERGITLVEGLAALVILSIIGVLIWNVFFQGYKYSQNAVSKNTMQQEANIIITNLTRIHQTSQEYTITNSNGVVTITATNPDVSTKFKNSKVNYWIKESKTEVDEQDRTIGPVNPKISKMELFIIIKDKQDSRNKVEIETLLYRL